MPQFGFYLASVATGLGGRLGVIIAWDPIDRGASAADDIDWSTIGLYTWVGPNFAALSAAKYKSRSPIQIPAENCPTSLDGSPDHDYFVRFGVKSGGIGFSTIVDGWLEVFEGNTRVYGINPVNNTVKFELADGSMGTPAEVSMQDRLLYQALEEPLDGDMWVNVMGGQTPAITIWRDLMTPNAPLLWL